MVVIIESLPCVLASLIPKYSALLLLLLLLCFFFWVPFSLSKMRRQARPGRFAGAFITKNRERQVAVRIRDSRTTRKRASLSSISQRAQECWPFVGDGR